MAKAVTRKLAVRVVKTKTAGKGKTSKTARSSKTSKSAKTPNVKSKTAAAAFEPAAVPHPNALPVSSVVGTLRAIDADTATTADEKPTAKRAANGRFESAIKTKAPKAAGKHTALSLVQKIYNTINLELTKLEEQTGLESQDRERASRALSQIVSSLGKASGMQTDIKKASKKGAKKADTEALAHAETLRREIAERVERISRGLASRKGAG